MRLAASGTEGEGDEIEVAKLRGLEPEDPAFIRSLVMEEGWNAGVHDVETFTEVDPDAWIVAEIDDAFRALREAIPARNTSGASGPVWVVFSDHGARHAGEGRTGLSAAALMGPW